MMEMDIAHARSRLPAWLCYLALRQMPAATRSRFVITVHGPHSVNTYSRIMTRGERVNKAANTKTITLKADARHPRRRKKHPYTPHPP